MTDTAQASSGTYVRTKRPLSILVHASSKAGKTTFSSSAPLPLLALDAEGGWSFMGNSPYLQQMYGRPLNIIHWDPCAGPPPDYDGTWEICVAGITTWNALECAYNWLVTGRHQFKSLVVDSITELQRRCKMNLVAPTEQMKMQHWGTLLTLMDATIRGLRDLKDDVRNTVEVCVFIAETRMLDGKWRPSLQGQIVTALPYWMDIVGYLFVEDELDANGQPTQRIRKMLIGPHNLYESGERVQGALGGDIVSHPNVQTMLTTIYGHVPS